MPSRPGYLSACGALGAKSARAWLFAAFVHPKEIRLFANRESHRDEHAINNRIDKYRVLIGPAGSHLDSEHDGFFVVLAHPNSLKICARCLRGSRVFLAVCALPPDVARGILGLADWFESGQRNQAETKEPDKAPQALLRDVR
jgi:hypothetical protein